MLCVFALASVFVTYFYLFLLCYFSLHFASSLPFFFCCSYKKRYWPRKCFHWRKIVSIHNKNTRKEEENWKAFLFTRRMVERRRKTEGKFFLFFWVRDAFQGMYSLGKFFTEKGGKTWDHFSRALIPWTWKHEIVQKSFRFMSKRRIPLKNVEGL